LVCFLYKHKKKIPTHWVGVNGEEYPINEYMNWGGNIIKNGKKDLPKEGYPYVYKYETKPLLFMLSIM
jgi:hypothetical protein